MKQQFHHQRGGSTIVNLLLLALAAYAIYVGIRYVPIALESRAMDSVFDTVRDSHGRDPITSPVEAEARIAANLNINGKDNLISEFEVGKTGDKVVISARYDRELNLLYKTKTITYDRKLTLD